MYGRCLRTGCAGKETRRAEGRKAAAGAEEKERGCAHGADAAAD